MSTISGGGEQSLAPHPTQYQVILEVKFNYQCLHFHVIM